MSDNIVKNEISFESVLHIPLSQYAFAVNNQELVIRIRTKKNDLNKCQLYYGNRVNQKMPLPVEMVDMELRHKDEFFDYYETKLVLSYCRICYYFRLEKEECWTYYYDNRFTKYLPNYELEGQWIDGRSEYNQYPFILKEEVIRMPEWFQNAVVYNIFPDSFANEKNGLEEKKVSYLLENTRESENRLGGTIKGITANLDYLQELGFTCLYLNPIFVAGEYHKYDILDYYHIDPCLGTEEEFKLLVDELHERGMRIIIDGVFNHCSWYFFAFDDVIRNGEKSRYCKWFYELNFPIYRPSEEQDILKYTCFAYVPNMPKLNTSEIEVQKYFADVGAYWVREFHVDGWRLDVANEVNREFWRIFRHAVKAENPNAILIGEVWENAETWLRGDAFDTVMNYEFRRICKEYIAFGEINAKEAAYQFEKMWLRYPSMVSSVQLNLLDTHDVPRFLSLCRGDIKKWELGCLLLLFLPGVPSLFYGDERGISGILEYDYRKNMEWNKGKAFYEIIKKLVAFRNTYIINDDECRMLWEYIEEDIFAFVRKGSGSETYILIDVNGDKKDFLSNKWKEVTELDTVTSCIVDDTYLIYTR